MTTLPHGWAVAIDGYLIAQRAAGRPDTTIAARRQQLVNLAAHIGVPDPFKLTAEQLVEWAGLREWKPETRRSRRTTFLSFYTWAIHAGLTTENPAAALERIKPTHPHPRPVPETVYQRAPQRADSRVALMLRLGGEHGLRRGEIAVVHSRDLFPDLDGWSLLVHGKGNKQSPSPVASRSTCAACPRGGRSPARSTGTSHPGAYPSSSTTPSTTTGPHTTSDTEPLAAGDARGPTCPRSSDFSAAPPRRRR